MAAIKTYQDAIAQGYEKADRTYQRGYISRKANPMTQPIHIAGGGRRGEQYVLLPNWRSTQYCIRQYLCKVDGKAAQ